MISENHLNLLVDKLPFLTMNAFLEYMGHKRQSNKADAKKSFKNFVASLKENEIKEMAIFIDENGDLAKCVEKRKLVGTLTRSECLEIIKDLLRTRSLGDGNLSLEGNSTCYEIVLNIKEELSGFSDSELKEIIVDFIDFGQYTILPQSARLRAFYDFIGLDNSEISSGDCVLLSSNYNLDLLNMAGMNPHELIEKLKKVQEYLKKEGLKEFYNYSIIFEGASGVGKTEFAKFLASILGQHFSYISFGGLSSGYHGETESNIKNFFEEAKMNNSLVFIDEADSFLFNRQSGKQSFEISIVNEMLQQIEKYPGIVICSTNLLGKIDHAALRRFAEKITFEYLSKTQAITAFEIFFKYKLSSSDMRLLENIEGLSLGDFKVVRQKTFFDEKIQNQELIKLLEEEVNFRQRIESVERVGEE